ncbi:MAG: glycoside hydrolase family 3 C-terminal domain-containing protein [Fimbriimonas sp.]|nr:glycoside hydrolase family 3 C-terminal domain-containing protein [Fimbriimonas sp.]
MNVASRIALSLSPLVLFASVQASGPIYKDAHQPIEARVEDLLKRMTLQEKLNQLRCDGELWDKAIDTVGFGETLDILRPLTSLEAAKRANEVYSRSLKSRLGIPIVIHDEALHGLIANGTTSFPQSIGMAATWDPSIVSRGATAIAEEARARGVRHVLSPVINVIRDARWGRVEETYGEDPLLSSRMGVAFVKAFESHGVATTPKHYVDNSGDGGRDSHSINITERLLREVYLPPFEAVVKEAGASTIMSAYNSLNGRACSANHWLLTDVLRNEYGFKGWVASDYGATSGIMDQHHNAGTPEETAAAALNAGMDSEWPGVYIWGKGLDDAVKHGLISQKTVDESVRRVLRIKFKTGMFDAPFADPEHVEQIVQSEAHRKVALDAAREAMTLLKNDNQTLPLSKTLKSIAVLGPNAKDQIPLGGYSGFNIPTVSVLDGIKAKVGPGVSVEWAKGSDFGGSKGMPAVSARAFRDLKGEYFANQDLSGEPAIVRQDAQIDFNWGTQSPDKSIANTHFSARWTGKLVAETSGDYTISLTSDDGARMWINGVKVIDDWNVHAAKMDEAKIHVEAGQPVDFKIEYFQEAGDAVLQLGWGMVGVANPEIAEAVELAKRSDVAIVVAGIIEGEGQDRAYLDLPGNQEELIKAVAATGKPVVVVLIAGSPVTMQHWIAQVPAILDAWYPGQEGGTAIADVLFGDVNPGGKLPMTFPLSVGQCPTYYNLEPSGRGYDYVDLSGRPQFPFGFGLSYTTFAYSNLNISPAKPDSKQTVTVSFDVENTGKVAGDEVPQLYLHQAVSSIVRPIKSLQDFARITLGPGEKKSVTFTLKPDQLAIWNEKMKRVIEKGRFDVMIGASSDDIRLSGSFSEK